MPFSAKLNGFVRLLTFRDKSPDKLMFGALVWLSSIIYTVVYIFVI